MLFNTFNNIIQSEFAKGNSIDEVLLFNSLKSAFGIDINCEIIHGQSGMVEFEVPGRIPMKKVKCEAGDLLIVVFNWREVRYTLLQNKTMHNFSYYGTGPITVPVRQHHVLADKPIVNKVGKRNPHIYPHILSSAVLDSVGSFGVFYSRKLLRQSNRVYFDMNYMIANRLAFRSRPSINQFEKNHRRVAKFQGTINNVVKKNGYYEVEACSCLWDFELALKNMLIGTPITLVATDSRVKSHPLLKFLVEIAVQENRKNDSTKSVYRNFISVIDEYNIFYNKVSHTTAQSLGIPNIVFVDGTKVDRFFSSLESTE